MAVGEGSEVQVGNAERHISEAVVVRDGKEIAVVGIDHAEDPQRGERFAGRVTAERSLAKQFKGESPHSLLMDSLYCLTEKDATGSFITEGLIRQIIDPATDVTKLSFIEWQIRYAYENNAELIMGDPVNATIPNYLVYLGEKLEVEKGKQYVEKKEKAVQVSGTDKYKAIEDDIADFKKKNRYSKIAFGAVAAIAPLAYLGYRGNLDDTNVLTRRQVLKRIAGYGLGVAIGGGVTKVADSHFDGKVQLSKDEQSNMLEGFPRPARSEFGMSNVELIDKDNKIIARLGNSSVEINDYWEQHPSYQRLAQYNSESFPFMATLRNAIMADVLQVSPQELTSAEISEGENAKIGVVVGASHVIMPQESSVSYFFQNDVDRESAIKTNLTDLVEAARKEFGQDGVRDFLQGLKTFAKAYKIHPDGSVDVRRLSSPALLRVIDSFSVNESKEIDQVDENLDSTAAESTSTPTEDPTVKPTVEPTSTPEKVVDEEEIKAVRAKHLLSIYGSSMDKLTYGEETEPGTYLEGKVAFMKELVRVADELSGGDKSIAYKLAAVINFLSPGFNSGISADGNDTGGLMQLNKAQMLLLDDLVSFDDMISMPPVEQLRQVILPYLDFWNGKSNALNSVEKLALSALDPATLGKAEETPVLISVVDRQRPIYKKAVEILESVGRKPEDDGVLTVKEIGDAIRINAISMGELERNLQ